MFRHEALLYEGSSGFLAGTVPFIREGLKAREPVMVAVPQEGIRLLEDALGDDAPAVRFTDMAELGRNPARIIPAWRAFAGEHGSRPIRGIGEPIWAARRDAELAECQVHESLINMAFAGTDGFSLMCPYDVAGLEPAVIHEARCSHPIVSDGTDGGLASECYRGLEPPAASPLPPPRGRADVLSFQLDTLADVRELVAQRATAAGLDPDKTGQLVLAANELACNSVRHGGGFGVLRVWVDGDAVVCEVRDRGRIGDPLAGRHSPQLDQVDGWGLWIVNQTCDLVEVRSGSAGTVVRARICGVN